MPLSSETTLSAMKISERYQYSWFDNLIIAAALEANCRILYSEDMQHKQIIETQLQIINPFI